MEEREKENKKKAKHTIVMSLSSVIQSCATEASSRTKKGPLTSTLICHWQRTPKAYSSETPKSASGVPRPSFQSDGHSPQSFFEHDDPPWQSPIYTKVLPFRSGRTDRFAIEYEALALRCESAGKTETSSLENDGSVSVESWHPPIKAVLRSILRAVRKRGSVLGEQDAKGPQEGGRWVG